MFFTHILDSRRQQRDQSTLSIWPSSPKAPTRRYLHSSFCDNYAHTSSAHPVLTATNIRRARNEDDGRPLSLARTPRRNESGGSAKSERKLRRRVEKNGNEDLLVLVQYEGTTMTLTTGTLVAVVHDMPPAGPVVRTAIRKGRNRGAARLVRRVQRNVPRLVKRKMTGWKDLRKMASSSPVNQTR